MGDSLAALGRLAAAIEKHQHALDIISKAVNKSLQGQVSVKLGACHRALALKGRSASSSSSSPSPETDDHLAKAVGAFQKSQELFLACGQQAQYCSASLQVSNCSASLQVSIAAVLQRLASGIAAPRFRSAPCR